MISRKFYANEISPGDARPRFDAGEEHAEFDIRRESSVKTKMENSRNIYAANKY